MNKFRYSFPTLFCFFIAISAFCQTNIRERIETQGSLDKWMVVEVKESALLGGKTQHLYKIAEGDTLKGNIPYKAKSCYVWATTNVMANIMGIIKASNSVFMEPRGEGYCAKLEVVLEKVKVVGMINLEVVAQGSIVLGSLAEPIRDTKSPYSKVNYGIPFTDRPAALQFDYKAIVGNKIIRATGLSPKKVIREPDYADIVVILQKRWEDEKGKIFAQRVGTGYKRITCSVPEWINGDKLQILYGDIRQRKEYRDYMALKDESSAQFTINSKGKSVPIHEIGWAEENTIPTHIIIWFSSSHGIAFWGGVGNTLWVDNIKLVYDE